MGGCWCQTEYRGLRMHSLFDLLLKIAALHLHLMMIEWKNIHPQINLLQQEREEKWCYVWYILLIFSLRIQYDGLIYYAHGVFPEQSILHREDMSTIKVLLPFDKKSSFSLFNNRCKTWIDNAVAVDEHLY